MASSTRSPDVPCQPYWLPGSLDQYRADPNDPIDGWLQRPESANAATVEQIIRDLCLGLPDVVIDPFCGTGSTAVAARRMGRRFFGVDTCVDRVAVTMAKSLATTRHADQVLDQDLLEPSSLVRFLLAGDRVDLDAAALAITGLAAFSTPVDRRAFVERVGTALKEASTAVAASVVLASDSTMPSTWGDDLAGANAAVFASPPFLASSQAQPLIGIPPAVRQAWVDVIVGHGPGATSKRTWRRCRPSARALTTVLSHVRDRTQSGTFVLECEDPDDGMNALALARSLGRAGFVERRLLMTEDFSGNGTLILVTGRWE